MNSSVVVEGQGPVRTIRLGRPPINALDAEALDRLGAAADNVATDAGCRVVVLASTIEGLFCAGGDLKFWRTFPKERAADVSRAGREAFARIARMEKPAIAAIDGHVIGDGIALALSCDLRIASPRATSRLPEARYGFIPGWGTLDQLARTIGPGRTLDMFLTGRAVDAGTAATWGLVSPLSPVGTFPQALDEIVAGLLSMSPTILALAKAALKDEAGRRVGIAGGETAAFHEAWGGEDWRERIAALFARRPPEFGPRRPPWRDGHA